MAGRLEAGRLRIPPEVSGRRLEAGRLGGGRRLRLEAGRLPVGLRLRSEAGRLACLLGTKCLIFVNDADEI